MQITFERDNPLCKEWFAHTSRRMWMIAFLFATTIAIFFLWSTEEKVGWGVLFWTGMGAISALFYRAATGLIYASERRELTMRISQDGKPDVLILGHHKEHLGPVLAWRLITSSKTGNIKLVETPLTLELIQIWHEQVEARKLQLRGYG